VNQLIHNLMPSVFKLALLIALVFSTNCSLLNIFSSFFPAKTTTAIKQTPAVQAKATTQTVTQPKLATTPTTKVFNQQQ
jgi:hypothetical protein